MMNEQLESYLIALACLAGGAAAGYLLEKIVLNRLKKLARRTKWEADDMIISSFNGIIIIFGTITGIYFGIQYLPDSESLKSASGKIVFATVALTLTVLASRIIVGIVKIKTIKTTGVLPSTSIISNIIRISIYVIGMLVILQTLGISVTPILTALGVGGLAVALALQDTLSNLFSGVQIIASGKIRVGDYVKLDTGDEGYVTDITWRNMTIRMLANNLVVIPNSRVASSILTNYHLPDRETAVLMQVGVSYDSDLEKVERITMEAAEQVMVNVEGGIKDFKPFIRYHTFGDSSINFTVILRAQEFTNQYLIKHEFVKVLHKHYKENSIEIPFPIRTVYMKNSG